MKTRGLAVVLLLLLLCAIPALADVSYEGHSFAEDAEYIDLENLIVTDFASFADFLAKFPNLKQVDMWGNKMTKEQCDFLASRFPEMRWGWTMIIRRGKCVHEVRTDFTSWSTLHNNKSPHHSSEDFTVLKYCWNLMALDVGHNEVTNLDFLYDLPNLRVLIIACNQVEDITPIASLKKLEYAELFNNKIRDITPLASCPELEYLEIANTYCEDLRPLSGLKKLRHLNVASIGYDFYGDGIRPSLTDISPVSSSTSISNQAFCPSRSKPKNSCHAGRSRQFSGSGYMTRR